MEKIQKIALTPITRGYQGPTAHTFLGPVNIQHPFNSARSAAFSWESEPLYNERFSCLAATTYGSRVARQGTVTPVMRQHFDDSRAVWNLGLFAAWSCNWWSRGAFSELRALSDQHVLFQVDKDFMVRTWISSVQNWIEVDIAFGCTTLCAMAASDSWTLCLGAMSCFNFQIIGYLQRPFLSILCHPFLAFLDLFISSPKSPCQFAQGGHALWMWTGCCRVFVLCLHGVVTMHILRMYSNDRGFFGHISLWLNLNETLGITLKVVTWSSDVFGMWT